MSVEAHVTFERGARQPWRTTTTGPSGITRRRHYLLRKAAILAAADYLTLHDERTATARLTYEKRRREIHAEHIDRLDKEAPADV